MSKKSTYDDALLALTDVLSKREKGLDAREEKLRKAEESFEVDRTTVYGDTSPMDVLHLNIGGTGTTVLRRTLTSVPGSMLASKFSGRWDDSIEKDKDDNFFIDEEFSLFHPMLKYLRNKAHGIDQYPLDSPTHLGVGNTTQDFYRMVEYYGMTNGIYPTNLAIHTGSEDSVEFFGPKEVNAKEWTTFQLVEEGGHKRRVKSYEVRLGDDVKRIQIGWKFTDSAVTFNEGTSQGVGDVSFTYALDLTRSTYLVDGKGDPIDRLEHQKGTVIRSEDYGKVWYVDGETVCPSSKEKFVDHIIAARPVSSIFKGMCPMISIKGGMEITSIELED
jgi:hypothetical protein